MSSLDKGVCARDHQQCLALFRPTSKTFLQPPFAFLELSPCSGGLGVFSAPGLFLTRAPSAGFGSETGSWCSGASWAVTHLIYICSSNTSELYPWATYFLIWSNFFSYIQTVTLAHLLHVGCHILFFFLSAPSGLYKIQASNVALLACPGLTSSGL